MEPASDGHSRGAPRLLLLNLRGEPMGPWRSRFRDQGWRVREITTLREALAALDEGGEEPAVVVPLTLSADTLEWEQLGRRLSPATDRPWLVLAWEASDPAQAARLTGGADAVADWLTLAAPPAEAERRLQRLTGLAGRLSGLHQRLDELEERLLHDDKTGLNNERFFRERLEEEFQRARRHGSPLTLLLLDLDDFKQINDRTSYQFGDQVLAAVGEVLKRSLRVIDLPARLGGDEFAVLLPSTGLEAGLAVARRIRDAAHRHVVVQDREQAELHFSIGLATYPGHGLPDARQLELQANHALKQAKRSGKDRILFHDPRRRGAQTETGETGEAGSRGASAAS
ncbi:MAG TPA: diguanylate cyclase [Planctomycetota bacterium]